VTPSARLLRRLYAGPRGPAPAVANPYRDEVPGLDRRGAARRRRRNLEAYLERVGRPGLLVVGEALGFRGGRFSGIAFTSERQLAGPAPWRLAWAEGSAFASSSLLPRLHLEPSATVVWRALDGDPRGVLLWNAFPWHPWGARGPLSNRPPQRRLLAANLDLLEGMLAWVAGARVVALGRTAQTALADLGVRAPLVRHPAHGGAARCLAGLRRRARGARAILP
jgi:hypothetical protein